MLKTALLLCTMTLSLTGSAIADDSLDAPSELTCVEGDVGVGGHSVTLTWSNEATYSTICIVRDGEVLEELAGEDEAELYSDPGVPPGVYVYKIVGKDDVEDCEAESEECLVVVGFSACLLGVDTNDIPLDTETHLLTVDDDFVIGDVLTRFDMTTSFALDWEITQVSPAGTSVTLHDISGGDESFDVTWTDHGGENGGPYDCGCDMKPEGPGIMADYAGEFADGDWGLDLFDVNNEGTINAWCLLLVPAPKDEFVRGDADGNGEYFPILEAIYILEHGFVGGEAPPCMDAADVDDSGTYFPIIEALYILENGFTGGPDPEAPFPRCGKDETDDELGCEEVPAQCL